MTKVSRKPLPREDWEKYFDQMCDVFQLFKDKKEIRQFLFELWTYTERKMFSKRLQIARMLLEGMTYVDIGKKLHVTDTTIAAVSEMIEMGEKGFETVHNRLSFIEEEKGKQRVKRLQRSINRSENPIGVRRRTAL